MNLYGFVRNHPIRYYDKLGLFNPISGPNGPVGSGTGLGDPSIYIPNLPQYGPPMPNATPESVVAAYFSGFWEGLTEIFRNEDYRDCYAMCAWDSGVNSLLNPLPFDVRPFQGLGGYGDGKWINGDVSVPGGLGLGTDLIEEYYSAAFDAKGGTHRLDRLKDLLSRQCNPKKRGLEKLEKQAEELDHLLQAKNTATVWNKVGKALTIWDAWLGMAECYEKHCAKHCCNDE